MIFWNDGGIRQKGVIDIVSSKFELGRLDNDEVRIEIAPSLVAIPVPFGDKYTLSVWGSPSYPSCRQAKT